MRVHLFHRAGARLALAASLATAACSRQSPETGADFDPRPEPISIRVKNENFADANIAVVSGGVSRRLGQVSGNRTADFKINWSVANGQQVSVSATLIGQSTRPYTSPGLSLRPGQMIELHVAAVLRQSFAVVREP
jgi:hypothetical protein